MSTSGLLAIPPEADHGLHAVVESPAGSRNKLKYRPDWDTFQVDASLPAGLVFPFDFGFIPGTQAADGDPLDILVLMDAPAVSGCVVPVRLLGAIEALQREGDSPPIRNDRLVGLAHGSHLHGNPRRLKDVSSDLLDEMETFFETYDRLRGKTFHPIGRVGPAAARRLFEQSRVGDGRHSRTP